MGEGRRNDPDRELQGKKSASEEACTASNIGGALSCFNRLKTLSEDNRMPIGTYGSIDVHRCSDALVGQQRISDRAVILGTHLERVLNMAALWSSS